MDYLFTRACVILSLHPSNKCGRRRYVFGLSARLCVHALCPGEAVASRRIELRSRVSVSGWSSTYMIGVEITWQLNRFVALYRRLPAASRQLSATEPELCKIGWTDRGAVWCADSGMGPRNHALGEGTDPEKDRGTLRAISYQRPRDVSHWYDDALGIKPCLKLSWRCGHWHPSLQQVSK